MTPINIINMPSSRCRSTDSSSSSSSSVTITSHAVELGSMGGFLVGTDLEIRTDGMGTTQLGKLTSLEGFFDGGLAAAGEGGVSDPAHLDSTRLFVFAGTSERVMVNLY